MSKRLIIAAVLLVVASLALYFALFSRHQDGLPILVANSCIRARYLPLEQVLQNPQEFNGKEFCLDALYVGGWEVSILTTQITVQGDRVSTAQDEVWAVLDSSSPLFKRLTCSRSRSGGCWGHLRLYGRFDYSSIPRFGHLNSYLAQFTMQ